MPDLGSNILLVDDESNILTSLRRLLDDEDEYDIFTAESGQDGLKILEENAIDLIISDMRMPHMDGATFLGIAAEKWPDAERILLTGFSDINSTVRAVNEGNICHYITKPWDDDDLLHKIKNALENSQLKKHNNILLDITKKQNQQLLELTDSLELKVKNRTAELEQASQQVELAYNELKVSYTHSVQALAHLSELNEKNKKGHADRVSELSKLIAEELNLSEDEIEAVYFAGLLHDIGKIGIDSAILQKSPSSLNESETKRYQQHPVLGEAALFSLEPLRDTASIIRSHHERYDGKGFPDGLPGRDIPMGSKIVAIANNFDSIQLPNNFLGKQLAENQALEYIISESQKRFDPLVVNAFQQCYQKCKHIFSSSKECLLPTEKLKEDMVLAQDLINSNNMVMLAAGRKLSEWHISKLKEYETTFKIKLQISITQPPDEEQ